MLINTKTNQHWNYKVSKYSRLPNPQSVFYVVWTVIAAVSVFIMVSTRGGVFSYYTGEDKYMDFFNHIKYVSSNGWENVYSASQHACFPPLIYFMYGFFGLIIPADSIIMYDAGATAPSALLLYVWYCVIVGIIFAITIIKMIQQLDMRRQCRPLFTILTIVASNIFIFRVLERGNSVILACILLMWAMILRSSEKKSHQELALVMIAAAAAVKVYPAVFGLLYIAEKRWKQTVRLIIYGILFFFVPFAFFGGFEGIKLFFLNQLAIQSSSYVTVSSIKSLYMYIASLTGHEGNEIISIVCDVLFFVLATISVFGQRNLWGKVYLIISISILCPLWSGIYTGIYMSLPLIIFLSKADKRVMNYIYAAMFAMIFSLCAADEKISLYISYIPVYVMSLILIIFGLSEVIKQRTIFIHEKTI